MASHSQLSPSFPLLRNHLILSLLKPPQNARGYMTRSNWQVHRGNLGYPFRALIHKLINWRGEGHTEQKQRGPPETPSDDSSIHVSCMHLYYPVAGSHMQIWFQKPFCCYSQSKVGVYSDCIQISTGNPNLALWEESGLRHTGTDLLKYKGAGH